jgi:Raf kinase inhibitor-like YbhB/YbcL family protein
MKKFIVFLAGALVLLASCAAPVFKLSSSASDGKPQTGFDSKLVSIGRLNSEYLGSNSPPFEWSGLPEGTKSVAVVLDDPDARLVMKAFGMDGDTYYHWTATDIDPSLGGLKAGAAAALNAPQGIVYQGPAPPADVPADAPKPIIHIYRLTVYALSAPTGLEPGYSPEALLAAVKDKTLGTAQLNFSYSAE